MKIEAPLTMRELAVYLGWPDTRAGARRATRLLRRLEKIKGTPFLFSDVSQSDDGEVRQRGKRLYTSLPLLRKHCSELVDRKSYIDRQVAERWEGAQEKLRVLESVVRSLGARVRKNDKRLNKLESR